MRDACPDCRGVYCQSDTSALLTIVLLLLYHCGSSCSPEHSLACPFSLSGLGSMISISSLGSLSQYCKALTMSLGVCPLSFVDLRSAPLSIRDCNIASAV